MSDLRTALVSEPSVLAAELRPPRRALGTAAGIDAWIDTYHAIRSLTRQRRFVFITDSAVGTDEEDNLRHLSANLGPEVPRDRVVPFLTTKHSLEYCQSYADRAVAQGFRSLVVLGGDRRVGAPRCVEHAWQLRKAIAERKPLLSLGGWANPNRGIDRQIDYLLAPERHAAFYLTQIVSHHDRAPVERFVSETRRRSLDAPGVFGVFYYRSANPRTLEQLGDFIPVPAAALTAEFASGAGAADICARTLHWLGSIGVSHVYISNLPLGRAQAVLTEIVDRAAAIAL